MNYSAYELLFFFFIYSFIGWMAEVAFAALTTGEFVNRGFLNEPACPIYGFGVLAVVYFLTPVKNNKILLFFGAMLLTSALEYLTGLLLEKIFHNKWWDYSDMPFNIKGYICLKFSVMWGLACVFIVDTVHPAAEFLVSAIPAGFGWWLLAVFALLMTADAIATANTIFKLNKRLEVIDDIGRKMRELSDDIGEKISAETLMIAETGEGLKSGVEIKKAEAEKFVEELKADAEKRVSEAEDRAEAFAGELKEALKKESEEKKARAEERKALIAEKRAKLKELSESRADIIRKRIASEERLLRVFPRMKSKLHKEILEDIKKRIK